jgi:hypothetical protein
MNALLNDGHKNLINKRNLLSTLFVLSIVLFTGCAAIDEHDRAGMTKLTPISESKEYGLWRYEVLAMTVINNYGLGEAGEATRMRWLIEVMQLNKLPTVGYEIIDKKTVAIRQASHASSYNVIYTVKIPKVNGLSK